MYRSAKKLTIIAMLCALAYLVMLVGRVPIVMFLKYDPKDVIIAIGGFIYGPLTSLVISVIVSLVEMFTVSETGIIGFSMNVIATCAFACTAAFIYKKNRTLKGAVIGLVVGAILMTALMLLWNYFITPLYMGLSREAVAAMLVPAFLPFNLLKGALNAAFTMLLYKPVASALHKTNLLPKPETSIGKSKNLGVALVSLLVLASCTMLALVMNGVI